MKKIIIISLSFLLFEDSPFFSFREKKHSPSSLEIYFLDVGEADSTLIRYQDINILIDAGNKLDGEKLSKYFKDLGISSFDLVVATHPHEDHIGGMAQIIHDFPISSFYMTNISTDFLSYTNMMKELYNKNISYTIPLIDSTFSYSDLKFTVLSIGEDSTNINDSSIVLKLDFFDTSFLFMSDVSSEIEYSIISCGLHNDYYHPHQVVLDKLNRISSNIYRTDLNNTIHLVTNGDTISIETIETDTNGGDLEV